MRYLLTFQLCRSRSSGNMTERQNTLIRKEDGRRRSSTCGCTSSSWSLARCSSCGSSACSGFPRCSFGGRRDCTFDNEKAGREQSVKRTAGVPARPKSFRSHGFCNTATVPSSMKGHEWIFFCAGTANANPARFAMRVSRRRRVRKRNTRFADPRGR